LDCIVGQKFHMHPSLLSGQPTEVSITLGTKHDVSDHSIHVY
jgi:hypothetical protein